MVSADSLRLRRVVAEVVDQEPNLPSVRHWPNLPHENSAHENSVLVASEDVRFL